MAYADKTLIREKEVRLRLNDREWNVVRSVVEYTGQQMGPMLREMLLSHAELVLSGQADIAMTTDSMEASGRGRQSAI